MAGVEARRGSNITDSESNGLQPPAPLRPLSLSPHWLFRAQCSPRFGIPGMTMTFANVLATERGTYLHQ